MSVVTTRSVLVLSIWRGSLGRSLPFVSLVVALTLATSASAQPLPGEVLDHQRTSATEDGFQGDLNTWDEVGTSPATLRDRACVRMPDLARCLCRRVLELKSFAMGLSEQEAPTESGSSWTVCQSRGSLREAPRCEASISSRSPTMPRGALPGASARHWCGSGSTNDCPRLAGAHPSGL